MTIAKMKEARAMLVQQQPRDSRTTGPSHVLVGLPIAQMTRTIFVKEIEGRAIKVIEQRSNERP